MSKIVLDSEEQIWTVLYFKEETVDIIPPTTLAEAEQAMAELEKEGVENVNLICFVPSQ